MYHYSQWLGRGILLLCVAALTACSEEPASDKRSNDSMSDRNNLQTATFGSGCFWCTEAIYELVEGVESIVSGYAGGKTENPTYEEVCSGSTGHAEVVQLQYDPAVVSYERLLTVFFDTHDPTTLNRQGNDVGTQYRSVIFPANDEQRKIAEGKIRELEKAGRFEDPIVTTIESMEKFYPAEKYHQGYFRLNPNASYCQFVIKPKVKKFQKELEK